MAHAQLSPSAADRWIACPASVRVTKDLPNISSPFAEEGTRAHSLGEFEAAKLLGLPKARRRPPSDDADMDEHAAEYARTIQRIVRQHSPGGLWLEQRVYTGIEGCWGTADCVFVSDGHLYVIDLKYGRGIAVSPRNNSQLMLYGLGAMELVGGIFGDVVDVHLCIYQPRIYRELQRWDTTADHLREWRDSIRGTAADALAGSNVFKATEKGCRFCLAAGTCSVLAEYQARNLMDLCDAAEMTPEELASTLEKAPSIRAWLDAVEAAALARAVGGGDVPRHRLAVTGGRRYFPDQAAAGKAAVAAGADPDDVWTSTPKLASQATLRTLLGRKRFREVLEPLLVKSEGKLALVSEDSEAETYDPLDTMRHLTVE